MSRVGIFRLRLVILTAPRPSRVVTVAMANKTARIAWAVMARGETYRPIAKV